METEENVVEAYNLTNDASGNGLKDALQLGKMVTLILTTDDDTVAETYAGLKRRSETQSTDAGGEF